MIIELKEDLYRYAIYEKSEISDFKLYGLILKYFFVSSSFRAIFFYRLANQKFVRKLGYGIIFSIIGSLLSGIFITPNTKIGSGLLMGKPKCISIHPRCKIGKNVSIFQGVTIGGNIYKKKKNQVSPYIGNNVLIGAGAKVLGPVSIGDNCMIGANAVVVNDIPNDSVAVGIPAKVVKTVEKTFIDLAEEFRGKN